VSVNRRCNFTRQEYIQDSSRKDSKIQKPYNKNTAPVEYKNKRDTDNHTARTTSESFRKYPSNIPEKQEIEETEKQPSWALQAYF
jgi:hypothetical protein